MSLAHGGAGWYGGGVYISNGVLVVCEGVKFGQLGAQYGWNIGWGGGGNVYARGSRVEVTGGSWITDGGSLAPGGGVYAEGSELWLSDAWVLSNACSFAGGGGIALRKSGRAMFTNVFFAGNDASRGGAVDAEALGLLEATLVDCRISNNTALTDGGGVFWDSAGTLQVQRCELVHNVARRNGGGLATLGSRGIVAFRVGRVKGNHADRHGGGWYAGAGIHATVEGAVQIDENWAGYDGGGLLLSNASAVVVGSNGHWVVWTGNQAQGNGGACALYEFSLLHAQGVRCCANTCRTRGGAVVAERSTLHVKATLPAETAFLPANEWSGNSASSGGALAAKNSTVFVDSIGILTNTANLGGAIYLEGDAAATFVNAVIVSNFSSTARDGLYVADNAQCALVHATLGGSTNCVYATWAAQVVATNSIFWSWGAPVLLSGGATASINYCDVRGGWPGVGNIDADPLFMAPPQMNYQLTASSPCINTGINAGVNYDCIGRVRPLMGKYDVGAYEYVPEPGWVVAMLGLCCAAYRRRKVSDSK